MWQHNNDGLKAITAYEKAVALNKKDPIYYNELDELYEISNTAIELRMQLFEGSNEIVKKRDDSFIRQIIVLTLAGESRKAVEYLSGRNFNYREGNSRVRDVIIDAQLTLGKIYFRDKKYQEALDHFLLARVPDEEAGSASAANRNLQVNYYIGTAWEALGNKSKAKNWFSLSANAKSGGPGYMQYYQGLSKQKLGKTGEATEIFNSLVEEGNRQIKQSSDTENDFFAKFGANVAENTRISQAYLLRGAGYKGLGQTDLANDDLKKAVELSAGNLWANTESNEM
jgi:tetratricopeptide (TPR) repeat protein